MNINDRSAASDREWADELARLEAAPTAEEAWDATDENGCPATKHHGVDCPGDACRFAAPAATHEERT